MKNWDYKKLKIAVFGDYCLDEYLFIDAALNEPSLETGLTAYQCTRREVYPGAAGTIAKNLSHLGVGEIYAVGCVGDDGRGLELRRGLGQLVGITDRLVITNERSTPTYTKPWLTENGEIRELNRIDAKNWTPTPRALEDAALANLKSLIGKIDALIIMDQLTEENCGIVTDRLRAEIAEIARENPNLLIFADSRCRIDLFEGIIIKGNNHEIPPERCDELMKRNGKPVVCTLGEKGVAVHHSGGRIEIPGIPLDCQLDVTGAGDMFSANFVAALSAGAELEEAARVGNIAASLCVQQLGTSGRVTRDDIIGFYA